MTAGSPDKGPAERKLSPLRSAIKTSVNTTNDILATLEENRDRVMSKQIMSRLSMITQQGSRVAGQLLRSYELRKQYGPEIIAGSFLFFSGLVGLRKGKLPGVFAGTSAAGFSYLGVYQVDLHQLSDRVKNGGPWSN